jgi:hypothetical protein
LALRFLSTCGGLWNAILVVSIEHWRKSSK